MEPIIHAPFDSPLRWLVKSQSDSRSGDYLVDLAAYNGNGECQCRYFICGCAPKVKQGTPKQCKHIRIARERFTNWSLAEFTKHFPSDKDT